MNPDKLFDYLDGKLSPADRAQLEEKLLSDPHLREQFNIARDIQRSGRDSRELVRPSEDPAVVERGGRLGRRIATGAIVLVFLNVIIGLAVITAKNRKPAKENNKEAQIRQQLAASLGAAAENAMPPPSFAAAEIQLKAPRAEWESIASRVIAASGNFDGSATKALPDDNFMMVVADIPSNREAEFRQAVTSGATITPMPAISSGTGLETPESRERTIVQIRIAEAGR